MGAFPSIFAAWPPLSVTAGAFLASSNRQGQVHYEPVIRSIPAQPRSIEARKPPAPLPGGTAPIKQRRHPSLF